MQSNSRGSVGRLIMTAELRSCAVCLFCITCGNICAITDRNLTSCHAEPVVQNSRMSPQPGRRLLRPGGVPSMQHLPLHPKAASPVGAGSTPAAFRRHTGQTRKSCSLMHKHTEPTTQTHVFGLREGGSQSSQRNPYKHRENLQAPHRQGPLAPGGTRAPDLLALRLCCQQVLLSSDRMCVECRTLKTQ